MGKKVLVTGASGFTGHHFISLANKMGYQCVALCHRDTDLVPDCFATVIADLADKVQVKTQIEKIAPNYVVHLAAISFVAHGDVADIYHTNLLGTVNLLDSLVELNCPIKKVLLASSGNVYGNNTQLPLTELMQPAPVNDYAISKYTMELAADIRSERLPIISVRPFNYTGVGQAEHFLIPKIVQAFRRNNKFIELGNLDVSRDFSDVRDVVSAYIRLLQSDISAGTFNVCTGKPVPLHLVIDMLNDLAGYQIGVKVNPGFVRSNEIRELYGSNQKLIDAIGSYQIYKLADTLMWMYEE